MSTLFLDYEKYAKSAEGVRRLLVEMSALISRHYFPRYELFVFSFLIQMMEYGSSSLVKSILSLLHYLLQDVDLKSSMLATDGIWCVRAGRSECESCPQTTAR